MASFPYQKWEGISLPLIPVSIDRVGIFYAIVDSGANISLFQFEIADLLEISLRKGKRVSLSGIGGKIQGYLHTVTLKVAGYAFPCEVCFSKELQVPLNLLGRKDFFRRFKITFDEARQRTILRKSVQR